MARHALSVLATSAIVITAIGCANSSPLGSGGAGGELTGTATSSTHASSSHATTSTSGATTSGAATTSSGATNAASSSSGGPMCQDTGPGEPNETMATAFTLPPIDDCDSSAASVKGVLDQTGNDVDWYKYAGSDTSLCNVDPTRQLIGPGIRICKYIECSNGKPPSFTCPSGTTDDTQGGHPGCCTSSGQSFTLGLTCGGTFIGSDDATVYIRVDHPGGPGCESYQANYHF